MHAGDAKISLISVCALTNNDNTKCAPKETNCVRIKRCCISNNVWGWPVSYFTTFMAVQ